ncbi:ABC multidrug transporter [Histoplasma capsulatum var. duboisii H88]|uniref:ABC multidrug transporter n=1 Tax=Ajellomyces capsulatus (strain H88) TaxID=544711 RepID=F0U723_AJEC8|nr:ABC multidrug transporter [Histoplasma capsulatum var. duboisii H88]QSS52859.1 ABC multidrug transporter [Histoplasma capsulatum var. duboisii H88]
MTEASEDLAAGESKTAKSRRIIRRATRYVRLLVYAEPTTVDLILLTLGILAAIASGVPFPLMGIIFGQLVDNLNSASCNTDSQRGSAYQSEVNDKALKVVYVGIAYFVLVYIYVASWNLFGERLAQRLRERYFKSLLRQDASFFDNMPAGEAASRLTSDITTIQQGTSEKVGIVLNSISFFITAYIIAFVKDAKLGGELVSLTPAYLLMSLVGGYYTQKYASAMLKNVAGASSVAMEALSNATIVHAFSANAQLESKFAGLLGNAKVAGIRKAISIAVQSGLLYFIAFSANGLSFWQGSKTIADAVASGNPGSSVGTTYTVIFLLVDATLILSQVAPFVQVFDAAGVTFESLEADINREPKIDGTVEGTGNSLRNVSGNIELNNVSFAFPSRPDKPVLDNVSMSCAARQHTAIVGLSGSGKSTVAGLIARLYDPTNGEVSFAGQNIKDLNVRSLRSNLSLVQQEPSLLDRSILENIALGLINSPSHSHLSPALLGGKLSDIATAVRNGRDLIEEAEIHGQETAKIIDLVRNAADLADASAFIGRLKDGYGTLVGSAGSLISGGQKQRISIARALVKEPKLLILDEATAALDSTSQQRVQSAIEKVMSGRTLISIAHRLSTIKNADNIIVMNQGKVVEQGTHSELISSDGAYAGLVRLQNLNIRPEEENVSSESLATKDSYENIIEKAAEVSLDERRSLETSARKGEDNSDGINAKRSLSSTLKAVGPMLRPHMLFLFLALTSAFVVGGTYSASAVVFGNTIGGLSPCKTADSIRSAGKFYGLMFFILAIIEFFANLGSWSAFGWVAEKITYKVRVLSFRALMEQDLQWHQSDGRSPTVLLSIITQDGNALSGLTGSVVGTIIAILVNLVVAIALSHVIAWKIALVCLAVVPLMLGAGVMRVITMTQFQERHARAFEKSLGITVEAVNSIKTISALSLEHEILRTYRRSLKGPTMEIAQQSAYANLWLAISYGVSNFLYALAYWWGAKRIIAGDYSQTQFFIVLMALLVSAQLWGQMFTLAPDVSRAFTALARILNLLDLGSTKNLSGPCQHLKPGNDLEANAEPREKRPDQSQGGISVSLNNVKFSYPARQDVLVLEGLDIHIKPGQFAALVGPSGAGKSTIVSLIERLYTPTSGSVHIDGQDISTREGVSFRDNIAFVPQDSVLFEGTIRFNVALGARPGHKPTDAEIEEACRLANIHDTIVNLPEGYNTNCGPSGNQLSGGQKQRLAIARALVRKPQLLLLDESTSALDAESEQLLQAGLEKATKGMTVIAIAHRLYTIQKADVIFLIEDGRCTDKGTHAELVERSESYKINALHQAFE